MRSHTTLSVVMILCGFLQFSSFSGTQRLPATNNRNIPILLCSNDECLDAQEKLLERCEENHFAVGQRVPNFLPEGIVCLCTCPGSES